MAKKPTNEEKLLADAAKLIMHIIRVVSVRLADRYERKLMTELVELIQTKIEDGEDLNKFSDNYIIEQLNKLSKE